MDGFGYGVPSLKALYTDLVDGNAHVVDLDHIAWLLGTQIIGPAFGVFIELSFAPCFAHSCIFLD